MMQAFLIALGMVWLTIWACIVIDALVDVVFKPEFIKEWFGDTFNLETGYWYKALSLWLAIAVLALAWPVVVLYMAAKND